MGKKSHPDICTGPKGECKGGKTFPCKGCSDGSDKCSLGLQYQFCKRALPCPIAKTPVANSEKWCVAAEYPWAKAMTDPCPNGDCRRVRPKQTLFSCKGCSDGSDKCVQAPWKYKFCFKCSAFSTTPAAKTAVVAVKKYPASSEKCSYSIKKGRCDGGSVMNLGSGFTDTACADKCSANGEGCCMWRPLKNPPVNGFDGRCQVYKTGKYTNDARVSAVYHQASDCV